MAKKRTDRATEFSRDLKRALSVDHKRLSQKLGIETWQKNWRLKGLGREAVDVAGFSKSGDAVVLVEAELLREDPASNVAKVWQWARARKSNRAFALFQAFSRHYYNSKKPRRLRAEFLAEEMGRDVRRARYFSVPLKYRPLKRGKVGAGRRQYHARRLAMQILRRVNKLDVHQVK